MTRIAAELGARYVLEGSVRKAGPRVRVNAQLIDAASGHHLWAKRYDRDLDDIFALQDEITETIVASIEPEIGRAEQQRAARKAPEALDAWENAMRAQWHINQQTREDDEKARRLLARAVHQDPDWSGAAALQAMCEILAANRDLRLDLSRNFETAATAARRALAVNEGDWLAHTALGAALLFANRHEAGIQELNRAIELNPSAARAYHFLGGCQVFTGYCEEAIHTLEIWQRLDPNDPLRTHALSAFSLGHLLLGNYEAAKAFGEQAIAAQGENFRGYHRLVAALGMLGDTAAAASAIATLRRLHPDVSLSYFDTAYTFRRGEDREHFLDGLRRAGLEI